MNIFLVKRTDRCTHGDFVSFVCQSHSGSSAACLHPNGAHRWDGGGWLRAAGVYDSSLGWVDSPDDLLITKIGITDAVIESVILASVNAG
jgi:hypothetical protein